MKDLTDLRLYDLWKEVKSQEDVSAIQTLESNNCNLTGKLLPQLQI
ncbi:hypothetical protein ES703_12548 [subsurface metagenome]|uniref:Uncharacterized protein n=1 Tax=marine sediment metagenome TaxID=412755 RepID=X1AEQ7_9ZZZZ